MRKMNSQKLGRLLDAPEKKVQLLPTLHRPIYNFFTLDIVVASKRFVCILFMALDRRHEMQQSYKD